MVAPKKFWKQTSGMTMRTPRHRTTECVTPGHPDKICDQIADAIVDSALKQDPRSRVAMEVHGKGQLGGVITVGINGELTTNAVIDFPKIVRETLGQIGYSNTEAVEVRVNVSQQSGNISVMANRGAGDQGMMAGYATNETTEFMPLPGWLARKLCTRLVEVRTTDILPFLRPDGKSQVTINRGKVCQVTLAAHYQEGISLEELRSRLVEHVINHVLPENRLDPRDIVINGGGEFYIGGFVADAGTTGRKIVVDQFGLDAPVGGGAFSGKDPTKVDRSAAYMARFVAKSVVASGHANKALVTVSYAIGQDKPFMINLQTDLDDEKEEELLEQKVQELFDFRPAAIIDRLGLRNPQGWSYQETAAFGHYGDTKFPWEQAVTF